MQTYLFWFRFSLWNNLVLYQLSLNIKWIIYNLRLPAKDKLWRLTLKKIYLRKINRKEPDMSGIKRQWIKTLIRNMVLHCHLKYENCLGINDNLECKLGRHPSRHLLPHIKFILLLLLYEMTPFSIRLTLQLSQIKSLLGIGQF